MGTAPINNPNSGTGPIAPRRLDQPGQATQPDTPVAPMGTPARGIRRDSAKTGPLDPTALGIDVDLDQLNVPPLPAATAKKAESSFLGGLLDSAANAADSVEHAGAAALQSVEHGVEVAGAAVAKSFEHTGTAIAKSALSASKAIVHGTEKAAVAASHVAAAGLEGVKAGYKKGDGLAGALGDGLHAAGQTAYTEAVDPLMTHAVGAADKAHDKAAGALGPLLTNRLAVGSSVDLKLEAGTTLPTELIGAPNVKLDGGGTLKIKRVEALDAQGKAIIGPDGTPETRLEVELKATGRAGAEYSAKVGTSLKAGAAGHEAGFDASAKASAEAGLTGMLDLKLRFNPDSQKDMGDLLAMTKATAATGATAAVPGIGLCFAALSADDYKRSFDTLGSHLEEVGGEGGLYAQASCSAKLNLGIFKAAPPKPPSAEDGAPPPEPAPKKTGTNVVGTAVDQAHDSVLAKLNLNIANIGASIGAQGTVGARQNYRTGETTYTIAVNGAANASAAVLEAGVKRGLNADRKINLVYGKDGKLKDITVTQTMTKERFTGAMTTIQDVYGRPLDPGIVAGIGHSDTVTVNYKLKPAIVRQVSEARDVQAIAQAAMDVGGAAITKDHFKLDVGDIKTDHRDELDLHFNLGAALGAELNLRGGVTIGRDKERIIS